MRNAIAVAEGGREGEVRYLGEVDASDESMRRVVKQIIAKNDDVVFCYEAGPTGYGLHRLITSLGFNCMVVAPSLIPRRPGDHVKNNRRDAIGLARLLRAGELTAVWVSDEAHEAMRDLVRARAAAVETLRVHRQQVSSFMLRHGRRFPVPARRWLQEQKFEHSAHQIVAQEAVEAVRLGTERLDRLERNIEEFLPTWSLAPLVRALEALRGVSMIVAVTFATVVGDLRRFENPRQLMGYLGLVPSERSTGETVRRGPITKAGNGRLRHMLVESAWTYRHPPRIGRVKLYKLGQAPPKVREIAWKAQARLTSRYRAARAKNQRLRARQLRVTGCVHVGRRPGGTAGPIKTQKFIARAQAGAEPTAGKLPAKLLAGNADARD